MKAPPAYRSLAFLGLLLLTALRVHSAPVPAETSDTTDAWKPTSSVLELRLEGEFDQAAKLVRSRRDELVRTQGLPEWVLSEIDRQAVVLDSIGRLPVSARNELAQAERLGMEHADLHFRGLNDDAISLADRQLEIRRRHLTTDHPWVAETLRDLGNYYGKSSPDTAVVILQQATAIWRERVDPPHPELAETLAALADKLTRAGEYDRAFEFANESLSMWMELGLEDHPSTARVYLILGQAHANKGHYEESLRLATQSLEILERSLGRDHIDLAVCLDQLAGAESQFDRHDEAETLRRRSLLIRRAVLGDEHPEVLESIMNLGVSAWQQGEYEMALDYLEEALELQTRVEGYESRSAAVTLSIIGLVYQAQKRARECIDVYLEAVRLGRSHLSDQDVANQLNNLSLCYEANNDLEEAFDTLSESLEIYRRLGGDTSVHLHNLAYIQVHLEQWEEAEASFLEALEMMRESRGIGHRFVTSELESLGRLYWRKGEGDEAEAAFREAALSFDTGRSGVGFGVTRAAYWKSPYDKVAVALLERGQYSDAWKAQQRVIGRALSEALLFDQSLTHEEREEARELRLDLADRTSARSALRVAAESNVDPGQLRSMGEAEARYLEADEALKAFRNRISERLGEDELSLSLEDVQQTLDSTTAILGWAEAPLDFGVLSAWGYVVRDDEVTWRPIRLWEDSEELHERYGGYRDEFTGPSQSSFGSPSAFPDSIGRSLWRERVAPFLDVLDDAERLIIVPPPSLRSIPVETWIDETGQYLDERFTVTYAPSATVSAILATRITDSEPTSNALVVADPPFREEHRSANPADGIAELSPAAEPALFRDAMGGDPEALARLPRLWGARDEAIAVAKSFDSSTVLVGSEASECVLERLARTGQLRAFSVVHVATHALVNNRRLGGSSLVLSQLDLPIPNSILPGERYCDGLLTAEEIENTWELDADLVVLSACETALGRNVKVEGTVGLAGPFLRAGARNLLLSLWKVDDQATALLFERFYDSWRGGAVDRSSLTQAEALREAKRWLRTFEDSGGQRPYAHPYFWSGFVLVGPGS